MYEKRDVNVVKHWVETKITPKTILHHNYFHVSPIDRGRGLQLACDNESCYLNIWLHTWSFCYKRNFQSRFSLIFFVMGFSWRKKINSLSKIFFRLAPCAISSEMKVIVKKITHSISEHFYNTELQKMNL